MLEDCSGSDTSSSPETLRVKITSSSHLGRRVGLEEESSADGFA